MIVWDVLVYLSQLRWSDLVVRFGNLALARVGGRLVGVAQGQWYRLLTGAFLHAGPLHLVTNMAAVLLLGPRLETALGRGRFLVLYVMAALGGSVLSFVVSPPGTIGVGASGAVFGLFGASYVLERRLGSAAGPVAVVIGVNFALTLLLPLVDWRAHLGGLVTGAAVAAGFVYAPGGSRARQEQVAACLIVGAALTGVVLLRTAALQG